MNNQNDGPVDLRIRCLEFSREIIRFLKILLRTEIITPIMNQIMRSATSIGANYIEEKTLVLNRISEIKYS